jgi:hypothetical protein
LNHALRFLIVTKFRKTESARISRELVANDLDGISVKTGPRKPILQFGLAGLVGKVAYKQFLQADSFSAHFSSGADHGHTTILTGELHPLTALKFGTNSASESMVFWVTDLLGTRSFSWQNRTARGEIGHRNLKSPRGLESRRPEPPRNRMCIAGVQWKPNCIFSQPKR